MVCTVLVVAAKLGVSSANDVSVSGFRLAGGLVNGIMTGLADLVAGDVVVGTLADPTQPRLLEWSQAAIHGDSVALVDALAHGARIKIVVHLIGTTLIFRNTVDSDDGINSGRTSIAS